MLFFKIYSICYFFFNLSSQFISKIIERQAEKVLHKKLKSFFAKEKILLSRKIIVNDCF